MNGKFLAREYILYTRTRAQYYIYNTPYNSIYLSIYYYSIGIGGYRGEGVTGYSGVILGLLTGYYPVTNRVTNHNITGLLTRLCRGGCGLRGEIGGDYCEEDRCCCVGVFDAL